MGVVRDGAAWTRGVVVRTRGWKEADELGAYFGGRAERGLADGLDVGVRQTEFTENS